MGDIDLNIFCVDDENKSSLQAILSLVNNNDAKLTPSNQGDLLTIEYEPVNQILKLNLKHWAIRSEYFINQAYNQAEFLFSLLDATAILVAKGYHLSFKSKFGTLIPYLKQKTGISTIMPTLYLNCQSAHATKNYVNLKDIFNDDGNDDVGTIITIAPVSLPLLNAIKNHLSFYQDWKQVIKTSKGDLLIPNPDTPHTVYLNTIDLSNELAVSNLSFLYSYDVTINSLATSNDMDLNEQLLEAIYLVLSSLTKQEKKFIYPTIFNNEKAKEWTFSKIQVLLTNYFNQLNPGQYVLCANDDKPFSDYLELVKNANKTVIKVNNDAYYELIKNDVDSIYISANKLIKDNYLPPFLNDDLTFKQVNNLNLLIGFMDYFQAHYEPFAKLLAKEQIPYLYWVVISNYPFNTGTYSWKLHECLIDEKNLTNLATLFETACDIVWRYSIDWNYKDFRDAWLKCTIDFFATNKIKKHDWEPIPTKQELKKLNKKWS